MKLHFAKILFALSIFLFAFSQTAMAGDEENECFNILTERVNTIYGKDLTNIYNGFTNVDISTYAKFQSKKYRPSENPTGFFGSQRNNIATIVMPSNYVTTQYVPFGNLTNFKFPIDNNGNLIGDQFSGFRNEMVYTHHNIYDNGSFLSCGYLRITPYPGYNLASDLDPANYFTNIIDGGGFEIDTSYTKDLGGKTGHFIVGKSVVQGASRLGNGSAMTLQKLFKIEILNVIYDNESTFFNEYETFPLQVDAMTNSDTFSTAWSLQQDFLNRVMNQTCLSLVHPTTATLPAICANTYQSRSSDVRSSRSFSLEIAPVNFFDSIDFPGIMSVLIPQASAALEKEELKNVQSKVDMSNNGIGNTIMMDSNFDYFEYKKINSLPSEKLRDYILIAINQRYDLDLQNQIKSGVALGEYDATVAACGIPYQDRVRIIKQWINELDVTTFSLDNIEYPDPKIGDCIIPFPDKRHIEKVIPGSFKSNQQYAQYLESTKKIPGDPRIVELKKQLQELEGRYSQEIQKANNLITSGQVAAGTKLLNDARIEYEPRIQKIQSEMRAILNPDSTPSGILQYLPMILIVFGAGLCLFLIYIIRRPKSSKASNL